MKTALLVSVVAMIGLVPMLAWAQPNTGGSGFGCDAKTSPSDNEQTTSGRPETNSGSNTRSASPSTAQQAGTPGTYSPSPPGKPITKADCERAHGTWEEMQMKCTRC